LPCRDGCRATGHAMGALDNPVGRHSAHHDLRQRTSRHLKDPCESAFSL
jgi:hypothetical protein